MMKKLLIVIAAVTLFSGFVGMPAPVAHADTTTTQSGTVNTGSSATTGSDQKTPKTPSTDYKLTASDGMNTVMVWIASLFAWLVGAAAMVLDYAAYYTVVSMGKFVGGLDAIGITWQILRDVGNIALIFGFLVAGLSVILEPITSSNFYGWSQKMIPSLLIAAVFLNFSLFITEAIIDVGNLFATQFYIQINGGHMPTPDSLGNTDISNEVISNAIMANLGIQTIYGNARDTSNELVAKNHPFLVGFSSILLFIMTAFVMFSLAFILIFRFVALLYYIIMSPLGFAFWAIPRMERLSKSWWSGLIEQTITAPVLLLLLYVALRVITAKNFLQGLGLTTANANGAATGAIGGADLAGYGGFLLSFLVAMGMLLGVLYSAKKLGAAGLGIATRMGGRLSFGVASLGARATLGGLGVLLASKRMQDLANPNVKKGDSRWRYALRPLTFTGKTLLRDRKFDLRSTGAVKGALGRAGVDAGKAATMSAREFASNIELDQTGRRGLNKIKPLREWLDKSQQEYDEASADVALKKAQTAVREAKDDLAAGKITEPEYRTRVEEHEETLNKTIPKTSPQRLASLTGEAGGEMIAEYMSPQQFVKFMESDDKAVTPKKKEEIRTARFKKLNESVTAGAAAEAVLQNPASTQAAKDDAQRTLSAAVSAVAAVNDKELTFIDPAVLESNFFVDSLSSKKFVAAMENIEKKQVKSAMQNIRFRKVRAAVHATRNMDNSPTATPDQRYAALAAARKAVNEEFKKHGEEESQYMEKGLLLSPAVAQGIPEDQFIALQKKGILNAVDAESMKAERKKRFDLNSVPMGPNIGPARTEAIKAMADDIKTFGSDYDAIKKQVPAGTLTSPEILDALGPDAMNIVDMADKKGLKPEDMHKLGEFIADKLSVVGPPATPNPWEPLLAASMADPRRRRKFFLSETKKPIMKPSSTKKDKKDKNS